MVSYFNAGPSGPPPRATRRASTPTTPAARPSPCRRTRCRTPTTSRPGTRSAPATRSRCFATAARTRRRTLSPRVRPTRCWPTRRSWRTRSSRPATSSRPSATSTRPHRTAYVLPKAETEFADAIVEALEQIEADGAYEAALKKWGVEPGASTTSPSTRDQTLSAPGVGRRRPPGLIDAVPVRHPGRWVAIAVLAVLAADVPQPADQQPGVRLALRPRGDDPVPGDRGILKGTLLVTVLSMIFGVALGVILAVMRLSDNPVLRGVSWLYTWFFRAIPRYVLLTIMGALGVLVPAGGTLARGAVRLADHRLAGA